MIDPSFIDDPVALELYERATRLMVREPDGDEFERNVEVLRFMLDAKAKWPDIAEHLPRPELFDLWVQELSAAVSN